MTCPYAASRKIITQTTFEYDEDGNQIVQQTVETNTAEFLKCEKEQCGAWRDGRCRYRGIE
ncbi:hypothetical protein SDC9_200383 [bioreactor metagenome]|uniref:Uncharacterized protein n=1 Tax=bioreactor metagenome TaxID=1076179 RepID=A0A645IN41_9ZZZZ